MKRFTKLFSLLLTGLLLIGVLAACEEEIKTPNSSKESPQQTEKEDEEAKLDFTQYENLSPEALEDAAAQAENIILEFRYSWTEDGESYESVAIYTREGNKVKTDFDHPFQPSAIEYYDLDTNLVYSEADGKWSAEESEETLRWNSFLAGSFLSVYTGMGEFGEQAADGSYAYTDESLRSHAELNDYDGDYSVVMTSEGTTYVITETLIGDTEGDDFTARVTATFTDTSVELPAV